MSQLHTKFTDDQIKNLFDFFCKIGRVGPLFIGGRLINGFFIVSQLMYLLEDKHTEYHVKFFCPSTRKIRNGVEGEWRIKMRTNALDPRQGSSITLALFQKG